MYKMTEEVKDFLESLDEMCRIEGVEWKKWGSQFFPSGKVCLTISITFPATEKEPNFREDMPRKTSGAINTTSMDPASLNSYVLLDSKPMVQAFERK